MEARPRSEGVKFQIMSINFDLSAWVIGFALLAILLFLQWRKTRDLSRLVFVFLLGFYLLLVIRWTVFPIFIFPSRAMQGHFMDNVNLIPFHFGPGMPWVYALPGIVLNTLLTMPIGFVISFITRFRPRDLLWLVAAFGVGIEALQLLISLLLGYAYRSIDVNDVIFNSLGVLLGYGIFRLFAWLYTTLINKWNIQLKGLFLYVYKIADQTESTS